MKLVKEVRAIPGRGLEGDRYCTQEGSFSFNKGEPTKRQVTLINGVFFRNTGFKYTDSRRNIVTIGVELMWLIGREFQIGEARFKGLKYCDPCDRPSTLGGHGDFRKKFHDRGGLIAEILGEGVVRVGSQIIPPPKGYK